MQALRRWWRWEMHRELEVTPAIRFITVERFVKGTILVLAGIALIAFSGSNTFQDWVTRAQTELNLNPGQHIWQRLYEQTLVRFGHASAKVRDALGAGAILYGLLELLEGMGLLMRRRWAEYLVLVSTSAFLPVEVDELARHPTPLKAVALLVNIAIMAYLVWRKRLFLERPSTASSASPA
ncbi:MAG TPA: DUF2127 domain-containing protein [Candidatus Dormibacteraeota bacterium]|nr:DUF2127 domain-containing protein [Candidatus Dormibacteraeota bacterium]